MTLESASRGAAPKPFVPLRFRRYDTQEMLERARTLTAKLPALFQAWEADALTPEDWVPSAQSKS